MDLAAIKQAQQRIKSYVKRTTLEHSETLSKYLGTNVFVKYELFQRTGSFKVRGAFNKLLSLSAEERKRGVVAISGGNHAQAVAYASNVLDVDAVVLMPQTTPQNYLEATRNYGATVDLQPTIKDAFNKIKEYESQGRVFIHPFDDPLVMAGQGTLGIEIMEDLPETTDIIISIGGGGFEGGVSTAVKTIKPGVRIWGVETIGADAMSQALKTGHPVELAAITSIAKTLGAPSVSDRTLALAQQNLEEVIVVADIEAVQQLKFILERLKVLTEPAASCTLAAALRLKDRFTKNSNLVLIFCGGNLSVEDLCKYINQF
ncbi:MAG TPA: threonine/serine dehydratase [Chitinophagaceae bacterium]|jgi:threonine dehydratase|nr:threonine/serine dehydratase [Chitinophagaceae bacterium]